MQIPGLHRPSVSRTLFRTDKASLCLERRQRRVMRLIISYPSRASALHTYHYLAMIYRVWSPRSFFMSLHRRYHYISVHQPQLTQTDRLTLNVWTTIGTLLSIVSPAGLLWPAPATSYLNIQLPLSSCCSDYPEGSQTAHNGNLHISPFWVITVFMYFRDKKFYGCRHHLVQLVLSLNSHNHFPSRLYLRSSCQVSALFSSQEFPVTGEIEKVQ